VVSQAETQEGTPTSTRFAADGGENTASAVKQDGHRQNVAKTGAPLLSELTWLLPGRR
jgi:hypothetical protein